MSRFGSYRGPTDGSGTSNPSDIPVSCPKCDSSSITTTAKAPDSSSYWRCKSCGEIWNGSRSRVGRSGGRVWR